MAASVSNFQGLGQPWANLQVQLYLIGSRYNYTWIRSASKQKWLLRFRNPTPQFRVTCTALIMSFLLPVGLACKWLFLWFDCDNKCSIDSWIKMIPNRSGNELMGFFIAFSLSKFHNLDLKMLKYCETHPSLLGLAAWWISFTKWLIWSENLATKFCSHHNKIFTFTGSLYWRQPFQVCIINMR